MVSVDLNSYFGDLPRAIDIAGGTGGAELFQRYDSFRAYSWLIRIPGVGGTIGSILNKFGIGEAENVLTLAAKQVGQIGFSVEDIMVDRVNDKYYYPGRPSFEETTVTFDNLLKGDAATGLFNWMRSTYDPITGTHSGGPAAQIAGTGFKRNVDIVLLDHARNPAFVARLYGCYPKNWRLAEFNYSANEFHSLEVTLRYDIVGYFKQGESEFSQILNTSL